MDNSHLTAPLSEKLKHIPGIFGIRLGNAPLYTVIEGDRDLEIRQYKPLVLASITINDTFSSALKKGQEALVNYLYGENKDQKTLKMLSPLLLEHSSEGWTISIILPQNFTLASAPTPTNKSIHLHKFNERLVASLRYSGNNSEEKISEHKKILAHFIQQKKHYRPVGLPQLAQYDQSSTITIFKKNEIHQELRKLQ